MVEVKLHDIGEGMTEGDILNYLIKEGDYVHVDQSIAEVQTEKMVTELTAPARGFVKEILIKAGNTIPVGTTLLKIEQADSSELIQDAPSRTLSETPGNIREIKGPHRIKAAPSVRKRARQENVDLRLVAGTGSSGRIIAEDVYRYVKQRNIAPPDQAHLAQDASGSDTYTEIETSKLPAASDADIIPFKGRRKQIAINMKKSRYTIPHVSHFEEIDMTNLLHFREEAKPHGNISVVAFFIKALVAALKAYPVFNAKLDEEKEQIKCEQNIHIGLATDTEEGLVVPVLKNADEKSLQEIHTEMKTLTRKAQENLLRPIEMNGSTFTISNVGPLGSTGATPVINYPETGLMAFHKTKKMPIVNEEDEIVVRSLMNVTLTFDHRVTDGGSAVAFTNHFKSLIEHPETLMLERL